MRFVLRHGYARRCNLGQAVGDEEDQVDEQLRKGCKECQLRSRRCGALFVWGADGMQPNMTSAAVTVQQRGEESCA